MKREELKSALLEERRKYTGKSYHELVKIDKPITYESGSGANWYQVEIQVLEKTDEYVHVAISVDDGKLLRTLFPLTTSFLVYGDAITGVDRGKPKR